MTTANKLHVLANRHKVSLTPCQVDSNQRVHRSPTGCNRKLLLPKGIYCWCYKLLLDVRAVYYGPSHQARVARAGGWNRLQTTFEFYEQFEWLGAISIALSLMVA